MSALLQLLLDPGSIHFSGKDAWVRDMIRLNAFAPACRLILLHTGFGSREHIGELRNRRDWGSDVC